MNVTLSALLLVTTFIPLTSTAGVNVSVTVSTTQAVSFIDELFIGVTLDSHLLPTPEHWGGLDFKVGGTVGDTLTFDPTGHGTTDVNHTFTGATWDALNTFVQDVNWRFIFGLNALKRKEGHWDPTNAKELLQYNSAKGYQLAGLELGNEPDHFNGTYNITGSKLGMDFYNFHRLLKTIPGYGITPVIGPDMASVTGSRTPFFADFFTGGGDKAVDRITFHQYYTNGHTAQLSDFTDSKLMDRLVSVIETGLNVSRRTNPLTPVWLGRRPPVMMVVLLESPTDTSLGFCTWLDKLGIAARMGLKAVLRQDFYAGSYALIDTDTFEPLPDYWLTVLYKSLVGDAVFSVEASVDNTTIRAYAHCTKPSNSYGYVPGSVTMYFLLPTDNTTSISFPQFPGQPVDVFWLTPVGRLTSKTVALNNNPIKLVNNTLPELKPYRMERSTVTFPGSHSGSSSSLRLTWLPAAVSDDVHRMIQKYCQHLL